MYRKYIAVLVILTVMQLLFGCTPEDTSKETENGRTPQSESVSQNATIETTEIIEDDEYEERDFSTQTIPIAEPESASTEPTVPTENTDEIDTNELESIATEPRETESEDIDEEPPRGENETERG